nr:His-Xaa-Ser system radical SAM maturase HxsC [uncultured Blautia sp.]
MSKVSELPKECLWRIEKEENTYAVNAMCQRIQLESDSESEFQPGHGDVLEVTNNGKVICLHAGASSSALIFVTNQCNSNCIMCPDSVKQRTRQNTITIEYLLEYVSLLPTDLTHIDITGGEPTLLKENLPVLIEKALDQAGKAEILMLSNGRSFAVRKYCQLFYPFADRKFKIEIPIHSASGEKHDFIAGCQNSFIQTIAGIHNLLDGGVEIGIRIVVSKLNYTELNSIVDFIHYEFPDIKYINLMGMEVMGNAWKNREMVWEELENLKPYLQGTLVRCFKWGIEPRLYNFPLCLFDQKYWYNYRKSISDYKIRYFEDCEKCREREQCGGFFASTFHHTKYKVRVQ